MGVRFSDHADDYKQSDGTESKIKKKKLQNKLAIGSTERTINSAKSATATRACNALSAPLLCSLTSMTRTLSYQCSNRAGDNQLRSRRLL